MIHPNFLRSDPWEVSAGHPQMGPNSRDQKLKGTGEAPSLQPSDPRLVIQTSPSSNVLLPQELQEGALFSSYKVVMTPANPMALWYTMVANDGITRDKSTCSS